MTNSANSLQTPSLSEHLCEKLKRVFIEEVFKYSSSLTTDIFSRQTSMNYWRKNLQLIVLPYPYNSYFCTCDRTRAQVCSPVWHRWGPNAIPGLFIWSFWRTKWHWNRVFYEFFGFSLSALIHPCSIRHWTPSIALQINKLRNSWTRGHLRGTGRLRSTVYSLYTGLFNIKSKMNVLYV